jgi:Heat shock protein 9/12
MSDKGRQSLTDKAAATLKVHTPFIVTSMFVDAALVFQPDSEKSTLEQVGDTMKGKFDSLASKVQPEVYRLCYRSQHSQVFALESEVHKPESRGYTLQWPRGRCTFHSTIISS